MENKIVAILIMVGLLTTNLAIIGEGIKPIDIINQESIVYQTNSISNLSVNVSGGLRSRSSLSWANASEWGNNGVNVHTGTNVGSWMANITPPLEYAIFRTYAQYDTDHIPNNALIVNATLWCSINPNISPAEQNFNVKLENSDEIGASIDTSDFKSATNNSNILCNTSVGTGLKSYDVSSYIEVVGNTTFCFNISEYTQIVNNSRFASVTLGNLVIEYLISHSPIRINSDSDFTTPNGVVSGSGTLADPYIISDWDINGYGYGDCIYVGNTTKHFVIRNCTLYNATVYSVPYFLKSGINLYNVVNATIDNNNIFRTTSITSSFGIRTNNADNITIINNVIYKEYNHIFLNNGDNITIDNNDLIMEDTTERVNIDINYISNLTLSNNILKVHNALANGILIDHTENVWIYNNEIDMYSTTTFNYGCDLNVNVKNILVQNNTISNAWICLEIDPTDFNITILDCIFNEDTDDFAIHNSVDNIIIDNCSFSHQIYTTSDYGIFNNTHRFGNSNEEAFIIDGDWNNITNCSVGTNVATLGWAMEINGDNNTVDNITVTDIDDDCINVNGKNNTIQNSFFNNTGGTLTDVVIRIFSDNILIKNVSINNTYVGIKSDGTATTRNTIIEDSYFYNCNLAIWEEIGSWHYNTTISNNTIRHINEGITFEQNRYFNITDNQIIAVGSGTLADASIWFQGTNEYGNITRNNLSNNQFSPTNAWGITGININTDYINVFHNDFYDNAEAHINMRGLNNVFDLGHQLGGNYYHNITKTDAYHGINQDLSGGDNIVDYTYHDNIGGNNAYDYYPLVYQYTTNNTPLAEAGLDKFGDRLHHFNGTNSSDAGGSALNYTWNYTYSATPYTFYGVNFSFNFSSQGIYVVTLNVTDDVGNYDIDTSIVYAFPVTAVTEADASTYRGASYQFNGSNSYYYIQNYTWNFTHNSTSVYLYGATPSFTFWELGTFNITLNVTDDFGRSDEDWVNITVLNNLPIADAGVDQAGLKGYYVLNGSASYDIDGTIQNYTWNFTYNGNPQTLYLTYPMFYFGILGDYLITLTVRDNNGGTDTDTTWVNISNANPVANAGTDIIGKRLITFDGSLSSDVDGYIVNWTWTFSDAGTPVTLYGVAPSYDFNISQAPIIVTLNVTDDEGGWDTDTVQVTLVFLLPIADAGADQGTNKGTFVLDGSGSSDPDGTIINWTWKFTYNGSPETLYGETPSFDFLLEGDYLITLNVTDDDWRYDEDTTWVNITFKTPEPRFSITPTVTNKGTRIIDGLITTDEDGYIDNYTYEWEYNSTTYYRYVSTFSFDFLLEGTYNITLNVTDDDGLQNETYRVFSIVLIDPVADAGDNRTILMFNPIEFDGSASYDLDGTIVNYTWNFTYNEVNYTFYGNNFTFSFNEVEGFVNITLNVTDDDGRFDTDTIQVEIQNPSRLLADLLLLLLPLFIILMLVLVLIYYFKRTMEKAGEG